MSKRIFAIEWPSDLGPMWLNQDNLQRLMFTREYIANHLAQTIPVQDVTEEFYIDAEKLRDHWNHGIPMDDEIVVDEPEDAFDVMIRSIAGRVIYKMLQAGEEEMKDTENFWINEYTEVLYECYPHVHDILQHLVEAVNKLKYGGIILRFNDGGLLDEEVDDLFIIEER